MLKKIDPNLMKRSNIIPVVSSNEQTGGGREEEEEEEEKEEEEEERKQMVGAVCLGLSDVASSVAQQLQC
jgi:hypothetical protein